MMPIAINPETKVSELLKAYPEVEDKLIARVPMFSRLRNPILRRSVARVATLEQAARIASIPVRDLVLFLREQTGQGEPPSPMVTEALRVLDPNRPLASPPPPAWMADGVMGATLDADASLASGRHPLAEIHGLLRQLEPGHYLRLTSSFLPAPLFDAMQEKGVGVWWRQSGPERYETFLLPQ